MWIISLGYLKKKKVCQYLITERNITNIDTNLQFFGMLFTFKNELCMLQLLKNMRENDDKDDPNSVTNGGKNESV